jgi:hypothetical protein
MELSRESSLLNALLGNTNATGRTERVVAIMRTPAVTTKKPG